MNEAAVKRNHQIFDAIDLALCWAVFILMIVGLGGFAVWVGYLFWAGLPILWNGSPRMWGGLWLGLHAIGFGALTIWVARSMPDMLKHRSEMTVREKALGNIWFVFLLTFGFGLNGFIPGTPSVTWTMPLWLAVLLTSVGGFGMYQVHFLRRDAQG